MTLDVQRFTRNPETVEAVQVTEDNMAEVAEWCGGELPTELRTGLPAILIEDGGVALLGEWVTRDEHGYFEAESAGFEHGWAPALPSTAQVTEYRLSLLPEEDIDSHAFEVKVSWRGRGRWAVTHSAWCLSVDGEWDYEPSPSNREDDWLATHRFPLDEALRLADAALPEVVVNGKTARDVLAERGEAGT